MAIASFLFALLMPWLLGFAIVKPFLKQRYGYKAFALGVGYVLGWFVTTLILRIYDYFQRPFDLYEIVAIECIIAIPLLFLKARQCSIEELRLEKAPSNLSHLLVIMIVVLLLYRWGLTAVDLLSKPVFPWDGWHSLSAKAKAFYYAQEILPLAWDENRFHLDFALVSWTRHPYFIVLIQTYTAMAFGSWSDGVVNLPWLGAGVAMLLCIFGGIRYFGGALLPSILAGYAVVSLPIFDTHVSLGSYADLWVGFCILIVSFLLVAFLVFNELRLFFLLFIFILITYLTKNTALVFLLGLLFVVFWHWFGKIVFLLLLMLLAVGLYFLSDWVMSVELYRSLLNLLSSDLPRNLISYTLVSVQVSDEWILFDNWHYVFFAGLISPLFFFSDKKKNNSTSFILLLIASFSFLLVMLILTFFTYKISEITFFAYFNRVSLYFIPVFALIPTSVYYLLNEKGS